MDKAPVSVVIPAFNSENFIAEALQSVSTQTLPVAEIIVVDDGSNDRTANISERLGAVVIRQSHRGISAARNAGIRAARSEWIAFLDADDVWLPEKIERQWEAIRLYPDVGLVTCDLVQWKDSTANTQLFNRQVEKDSLDPVSYCARPEGSFLAHRMSYNSPTMLIRKELLVLVGLFDDQICFVEGVECYLRIIARCAVALVNQPLVRERLHGKNASLNYVDMSLAWIKMLDTIEAHPRKYPSGASQALGEEVPGALIPLARALLDQGRRREARMLLGRSLRKRLSVRAMLFWLLTFVNSNVFNRLLALKHRVRPLTTSRHTI